VHPIPDRDHCACSKELLIHLIAWLQCLPKRGTLLKSCKWRMPKPPYRRAANEECPNLPIVLASILWSNAPCSDLPWHPLTLFTENSSGWWYYFDRYSICIEIFVVIDFFLTTLTIRLIQKIMQVLFTLLATYFIIVGILNLTYPFTHLR
jgi:hypothetical protein